MRAIAVKLNQRADDHAKRLIERRQVLLDDFERVHRCGVLSAEVRAGQYKYADIEVAAGHLHGLLDALR